MKSSLKSNKPVQDEEFEKERLLIFDFQNEYHKHLLHNCFIQINLMQKFVGGAVLYYRKIKADNIITETWYMTWS